jgi:hypothetical protein
MGAREELLAAATALTDRGRAPFAPVELIAEARSRGSNYPDSTLRTFIVGSMCVNSPNNNAIQYGDLRRVGRGLYRLARDVNAEGDAAQRRAVPKAPVVAETVPDEALDAMAEWWWEGNVQAAVVQHLAASGWSIRRVADTSTREHGVDIEATHGTDRVLVEVKGYPSAAYVRGPKAGTLKAGTAPLQARHYFGNALLSGLLMRTDHAAARVVIALPDVPTYRTLVTRTAGPLGQAGVEFWLVGEDSSVTESP